MYSTYVYSTRQTWSGEMGGDSIGRCEIISQYQSGHSREQTCVTRAPCSVATDLWISEKSVQESCSLFIFPMSLSVIFEINIAAKPSILLSSSSLSVSPPYYFFKGHLWLSSKINSSRYIHEKSMNLKSFIVLWLPLSQAKFQILFLAKSRQECLNRLRIIIKAIWRLIVTLDKNDVNVIQWHTVGFFNHQGHMWPC
jgi:hypothetical protein